MELLALLLPIGIDYINKKVSDSDARLWIAVGVCAVFGVFLTWLDTSFHFIDQRFGFDYITSQIMIVFGLAQLSFHALWSKTNKHEELRAEAKSETPKDPPLPSNL